MTDDGYIKDGLEFAMAGSLFVDVAKNNAITNNGATLTADHNGRANNGLELKASESDGIRIPKELFINRTAFSYHIGYKKTVASEVVRLLYIRPDASNLLAMYLDNTKIEILMNTATARYAFTQTANWDLASLIFDGNGVTNADKVKLFIDAVPISLTFASSNFPASVPSLDSPATIGSNITTPAYSNMSLDLVLSYSKPNTIDEVQKNYNYWLSH